MNFPLQTVALPRVLTVSISAGGIPKRPIAACMATRDGLAGDGRNHAKHSRPDRAVSLFDVEILEQLVAEGFPLSPGAVTRRYSSVLPAGGGTTRDRRAATRRD